MFRLLHPAIAQLTALDAMRRVPHEPVRDPGPIEIHLATRADAPGLVRLAQLDSALAAAGELPSLAGDGDVLVATRQGEIVAALSLCDGLLVSDPAHRSEALLALLHVRRRQIARAERPRRLPVLRPRHS